MVRCLQIPKLPFKGCAFAAAENATTSFNPRCVCRSRVRHYGCLGRPWRSKCVCWIRLPVSGACAFDLYLGCRCLRDRGASILGQADGFSGWDQACLTASGRTRGRWRPDLLYHCQGPATSLRFKFTGLGCWPSQLFDHNGRQPPGAAAFWYRPFRGSNPFFLWLR